jgi:hypothetical protein
MISTFSLPVLVILMLHLSSYIVLSSDVFYCSHCSHLLKKCHSPQFRYEIVLKNFLIFLCIGPNIFLHNTCFFFFVGEVNIAY